ncbi:MAG TPA: Rpn family recombination-promoting nuclease/putative transposase, partial [Pirellulaceae bacterium]|nr:Rpn family recombination-promoting nuclease/putative transposase [Pirellulaceae bacterium]
MDSPIVLTVDFAFKLTVGNPKHKPITLHFLNAVLSDSHHEHVADVLYLNPIIERDSASGKLSQLDIRLQDDFGRQVNVEMQTTYRRTLAQRLTYYAARLYTGQIQSGDDYRLLRPSIGIWLLDQVMPTMEPRLHLEFALRTSSGSLLGDGLRVHLLQLP